MSRSYQKINFDDSEWPAPKKALLEKLKYQSAPTDQADLLWSDCQWPDNTADPKYIKNLKEHQSINYIPNASETYRKDTLTENINSYAEKYPNIFRDVLPKSWNLPKQYEEFREFLKVVKKDDNGKGKEYFIVKENDEQRGVGIYITDQPETDLNPSSDVVVSKYIGNPLLVDGCKFDFRIHVLVASLEPFTVFVHNEGLMRMASFKYETPTVSNRNNMYMHLTNLSLNKYNKESVHEDLAGETLNADDSDNKLARSFDHFRKCLRQMGQDEDKVVEDMDNLIGKVLVCCYDDMRKNYENSFGDLTSSASSSSSSSKPGAKSNQANKCFQLLGFDIMFDENFKPWFIEVNHNPDLVDDPKICSLLMRKTVVDTMEKMSEINGIKFERTELTGEVDYDLLYEGPNLYRKVDIGKIRSEMEEEEERGRVGAGANISTDLGDQSAKLKRDAITISDLTGSLYRVPYAERRLKNRGCLRDN